MFPIIFLALLLSSGVVECGRRPTDPNTLAALAAAEQRRQQLHSTREDRRARARERTRVQHLAQHLKQQSPNMLCALPLSMHQQSKDGSSFTALGRTGKGGRMELRRSEEQFRWIAAPLNCSLTREHTAVEVYIGGLTHHWQANSFRHGMV